MDLYKRYSPLLFLSEDIMLILNTKQSFMYGYIRADLNPNYTRTSLSSYRTEFHFNYKT